MIKAILVFNNHGKPRLSKFYQYYSEDMQQQIIRETFQLVSKRDDNVCNFLEGGSLIGGSDYKLIYRHYATLYFVFCVDSSESELGILDLIQVFVETLDKCFENVCELDLIFHVDKVHYILNELVMGGMVLETNMSEIITRVEEQNKLEKQEVDLHSSERGLPCGSLSKCGFLSGFYRPNKDPSGAGELLTWQLQNEPFPSGADKSKPACPEQRTSMPYEESEEGNGIVAEHENLYQYWSSNSGMEIKNPTDARELYENLQLEKSLNQSVPSWADRFWPELKRQSDIHFAWLSKNQDLQRIAAGPLLGLMIQRMERHVDGHDTRKYFVYSGKSSSLAGLLAIFGAFDGVEPTFGSTVVLELHKFGTFYYVRVLHFYSSGAHGSAPEVVMLRGCSEYCPFDKFKLLTTGVVPLRWQQDCGHWKDNRSAKTEPFRIAGLLCCLLLMMYA